MLTWWAAAQESVSAVDGADTRIAELTAEVQELRLRVVDGRGRAHRPSGGRRVSAWAQR